MLLIGVNEIIVNLFADHPLVSVEDVSVGGVVENVICTLVQMCALLKSNRPVLNS